MKNKIKVLVCGEFSQLSTGFSTYMRYMLPLLQKTGKYEIAEFASYINKNHPDIDSVSWKVYPNEPDGSNPKEMEMFKSNPIHQFGAWRFNDVLLDFQPDVVLSIRDPWMDSFINQSPFRKHFKFIHMPTCDGEPQKMEWIQDYKQCDVLLTYSWWAKSVLERAGCKVFSAASPGTELDIFKVPEDKAKLRESLGIEKDLFIVNTVMRNQPRKLYPELFKAFSLYIEKCKDAGRDDLAKKSFLYCHTSYPDVGWNFSEELNRYKISHKVLFTYVCGACKAWHTSFFNGDIKVCPKCGNHSCHMPNTTYGVSREDLAKIMSTADVYVQYSVCEGFGMPIPDAKACGVPVMVVDYSAMSEQARNGGGFPIKVERMFQEPVNATNQWRALPDNKDLAEKLFTLASMTQEERNQLSVDARKSAEQYYDWNNIAKVWENAIDSLQLNPNESSWLSKPIIIKPNVNIPQGLSNEQFVEWGYKYILQEPFAPFSTIVQRTIAALNMGYEPIQMPGGIPGRKPVDRNLVLQSMLQAVQQKNALEQTRYDRLVLKTHENGPKLFFAEV